MLQPRKFTQNLTWYHKYTNSLKIFFRSFNFTLGPPKNWVPLTSAKSFLRHHPKNTSSSSTPRLTLPTILRYPSEISRTIYILLILDHGKLQYSNWVELFDWCSWSYWSLKTSPYWHVHSSLATCWLCCQKVDFWDNICRSLTNDSLLWLYGSRNMGLPQSNFSG